ncbi:hypothetical protein TTHERM_000083479 (macronuclear) [Tetrahymena thermophila SB210]|uniref:Uncharacterized protein n=1 Tax=Tetrahymena thermophila (strain SB210) TaxID=312017 RepID=W7XCQ4_TETTS|nr:hypothetical protein TTHERM_000083479 [Tetrahymena thermophila SB210]EWS75262.1 hypothetical protein TTHERM_000083479 [Tetrahymena thermophila SB210]|eukprot:XP_012652253.1 hypothetical protein TTHERM_000083479 [Tetrahymena thermophila SB210]
MIEEDNTKVRYLYVFQYNKGEYQKINYDELLQVQNGQEFDCEDLIMRYGEQMTGYFKILSVSEVVDNLLQQKLSPNYSVKIVKNLFRFKLKIRLSSLGIVSIKIMVQSQVFISKGDDKITINSFETLICENGQYLNQQRQSDDDICSPTPTTCELPNPKNICNCENFYYQKSTQKCIQCDSQMKFDESKDSCQNICPEGYFYKYSDCFKCIPNCLVCKDDKACIQCDQNNGFYLDFKKDGCTCKQGYYRMQRNQK